MFHKIMFLKLLGVSFVIIGTLVGSRPRIAFAQQYLTTHNSFVTAQVSHDGWGHITIYRTGTIPSEGALCNPNNSFLTVSVSGEYAGYYTNNPNLPDTAPPAEPAAPILLDSGTDVKLPGIDGLDTIETTWHIGAAFDIIQDVYPVLFPNGGQIVFRVRVVNHSVNGLVAQAQYLLDVDVVTSVSSSNDNAKIATHDGYWTTWQEFSALDKAHPLPPFYMAFEHDLGAVNFPGEIATGFLTDSSAPINMGLFPPLYAAIVSWDDIVQYWTWSFPFDAIGNPFSDEALLMQWPIVDVPAPSLKDSVREIASTSYGLGGYEGCGGALDAYSFYHYSSHLEPFPVTTLVFNPSTSQAFDNLKATLTVDSSFHILAPLPIYDDGLSQTQFVAPMNLAPASAGVAQWTASVAGKSQADLTQMHLGLSYGPLPATAVSCDMPILPLREADILPPVITILSRSGSFDGSQCNMRCTNLVTIDSGQDQTGIFFINPGSMKNMQLTLAGKDTLGGARKYFSVCVVDSMLDGSGIVYCIDGAQNTDSMYFAYCTIRDTLAPLVTSVGGSGAINLSIADNRPWDRGIATIHFISDTNVSVGIVPAPPYTSIGSVQVSITQVDTSKSSELCLEITDAAGNRVDTCFTLSAGAHPPPDAVAQTLSGNSQMEAPSVLIEPDPTTREVTLHIKGAPSANVEVFDVLGREVASFRVEGSYEWQTGSLPGGTYFVRAEIGNIVVTKKIRL